MNLSERKLKLLLFFSITFACVLSVVWHYDFGFLGGIPFGLRALTFSLFFDKSLNIDNFWQSAGIDTAYYNGHYFSGYPPGASFLALIFFFFEQVLSWIIVHSIGPLNGILAWWLESVALSLPTILTTAGTGTIIYALGRYYKISKKISFIAGWSYAFTTIILGYSWQIHYHPIAAFLVFLAFYLLVKNKDSYSKKTLFLVGSLYGITFLVEYVTILFVIPASGYLFKKIKSKRYLIYFISGFIFFSSLQAAYNYINFDAPWRFSHDFQEIAYTGVSPNEGLSSFKFIRFWYGFIGLYFSFPKGIIFHTPLLLLAPLGGYIFYKKQKSEFFLLLISVLLVSFVYSSWHHWEGGYNYGPRYLSSTYPLYIFLVAFALEKIFLKSGNTLLKGLTALLFLVSVIIANANALLGTRIELPLGGDTPLWSNLIPFERTTIVIKALISSEHYTFSPFWFKFYPEMSVLSNLGYSGVLTIFLILLFSFQILPLFVVLLSEESS